MIFGISQAALRDRVALIEGGTGLSWTYGQLADAVSHRQDWLREAVPALLFHFCRNDPDSVAWYLAAFETGQPVALLAAELNPQLRAALIDLYRPELIRSADPPGEGYAPAPGKLWRRQGDPSSPLHRDLALLLSTSGSTGSPHMVRLTRANVEANARSILADLAINERHLPVAHLPIHYSYGLSVLNSHLLAGATVLLTDDSLVSPGFWAAVRRHGVNSFSGVPYTYQMLRRLGLDKLDVPAIRTMTQAGGKLDSPTIQFFHETMRERGGTFWVMYGQTEATARISILPADELPRKPGSAGKAIQGGHLSILTDAGEYTTEPGVEGQLVYRGPNVMQGYANGRGDLASGDELGGCLHTGDRASLDAEGYVYILGRTKRDAKIFGMRVNLDELEGMVKAYGPAAVVSGSEGVVVFCEFGGEADHAAIREALAKRLRLHHSAFEFRRIDRLPTRDSGKIDYARLTASL